MMLALQRFAGVFRLVHKGKPVCDAEQVSQLLAEERPGIPKGNLHFSDPKTPGFYIITPPDEDEFAGMLEQMNENPRRTNKHVQKANWDAFYKTLEARRVDLAV